jgi:hypothetical protein
MREHAVFLLALAFRRLAAGPTARAHAECAEESCRDFIETAFNAARWACG